LPQQKSQKPNKDYQNGLFEDFTIILSKNSIPIFQFLYKSISAEVTTLNITKK
jgi:hypothetical protein